LVVLKVSPFYRNMRKGRSSPNLLRLPPPLFVSPIQCLHSPPPFHYFSDNILLMYFPPKPISFTFGGGGFSGGFLGGPPLSERTRKIRPANPPPFGESRKRTPLDEKEQSYKVVSDSPPPKLNWSPLFVSFPPPLKRPGVGHPPLATCIFLILLFFPHPRKDLSLFLIEKKVLELRTKRFPSLRELVELLFFFVTDISLSYLSFLPASRKPSPHMAR